MKLSRWIIASLALSCAGHLTPAQEKKQAADPVAWGMLSGTSSCVIFAEGRKTSGRFYGVAMTTKTVGKLTTVETQDYAFADKETLETQENMDRLTQLAQKDHVKFVKIPEKYSPELLDKARAVCRSGGQ